MGEEKVRANLLKGCSSMKLEAHESLAHGQFTNILNKEKYKTDIHEQYNGK